MTDRFDMFLHQEFSFLLHVGIPHMNYAVENLPHLDVHTHSLPETSCFYFWSKNHHDDLELEQFTRTAPCGKKITVEPADSGQMANYWNAVGVGYHDYYKHDTKMQRVSFPDFKSHFSKLAKECGMNERFDKPLVVINNKYSKEHGLNPVNVIDNDCISKIYNEFKDTHTIIYFRPESSTKGYVQDDNLIMEWNDKHLIKENHHEMIVDTDLFVQYPHLNYNELQCMMHSLSDIHFSTPGGNAIIASYFGGVNIIIGAMASEQKGYWGDRSIWKTDSKLKDISGAKIVGMGVDAFLECTESEWESWFEH